MRFRFIEAVAKLRPTAFAIGKGGAILKHYVGEPEFAELHALLEKAPAAGAYGSRLRRSRAAFGFPWTPSLSPL